MVLYEGHMSRISMSKGRRILRGGFRYQCVVTVLLLLLSSLSSSAAFWFARALYFPMLITLGSFAVTILWAQWSSFQCGVQPLGSPWAGYSG